MTSQLIAWIRFLRLPAVLTVPGDLWVGAVIAGRTAGWNELAAVSCAYLFGMGFNDWRDRKEDARERPDRPIPSGAVSAGAAAVVCAGLAVAAVGFLPTVNLLLLLITICAYTLLKGQYPLAGAVLMGLCRMQSVWIGTGADGAESAQEWAVAVGAGVLIFLLTRLSQVEGKGKRGTLRSGLFAAGLVLAAVAAVWMGGKQGPTSWAVLGAVVGVAIANHAAIERKGEVPPSAIGVYLGMWIPLQALWVLGAGRAAEGAFLIMAAAALPWLQRQIAIS
jgi:4-hydroxybenzoate polyprenyltransferase